MPASLTDQRTLWPGYVWPGDPPGPIAQEWRDFGDFASAGQDATGAIAVMNPASGPGTAVTDGWTAVVNYARAHGHKVLGYVWTDYGNRPAAAVETDIDRYYLWYPVDGIFFDQMSNDSAVASYYRARYSYVKTKPGAALVVGNPGAAASTSWQLTNPKSADHLAIFEGTQATYSAWTPPAWVSSYPAAVFAHLVYAVTDLPGAVARSRAQRAGYRYFTADDLPNPWDTLGHWPAQATP